MDRLTIPEFELMMEAANLRRVDQDYRNHLQAWLNRSVKAEKGKGKHVKPVFKKFKDFFDYKAEERKAKKQKQNSKFAGIGKLLKKGE